MTKVRTLLRYLLVSGAVVGLAFGLFVLRIGDRSIFGHLRSLGQSDFDSAMAAVKSEVDQRLAELAEANRPAPKPRAAPKKAPSSAAGVKPARREAPAAKLTAAEQRANERQVARLREGARLIAEAAKKHPPPASTRVEERIGEGQRGRVAKILEVK
jgi:hypothetical protein